jgi:signal transduction histidine kinase
MKNSIIVSGLIILSCTICPGQKPVSYFIRDYPSKEIKALSRNNKIIQDNRGVLYFGNENGCILEYDGANWHSIPVTNSLITAMNQDEKGRIYVGSSGEFGYLEPDKSGEMIYHSLMDKVRKEDKNITEIWDIETQGEDVFFRSIERVFRLHKGNISAFRNSYGWFGLMFTLRNQIFVTIDHKGIILQLTGDTLIKVYEGNEFKNSIINSATDYSIKKKLLSSYYAFFLFIHEDKNTRPAFRLERFPAAPGEPLGVYSLGKSRSVLGIENKGVMIMDTNGGELMRINEQNSLPLSTLNNLYQDRFQSIWITTDNGISRADASLPFNYLSNISGASSRMITNTLQYKGTTYFSTEHEFFKLGNKGELVGTNLNAQIYTEPADSSKSHLIAIGRNALFEIRENKALPLLIFPKQLYAYDFFISRQFPDRIFIGSNDGLFLIRFNQDQWTWEGIVEGITENIQFVVEDPIGNLWLTLSSKQGLIRLEPEVTSGTLYSSDVDYKKQYFNPPELVTASWIRGFRLKNHILFGTDKGLWNFDEETQKFQRDCSLGKQFCDGTHAVYVLSETPDERIFIAGMQHITDDMGFCVPQPDGSYEWYTAPFNCIPGPLDVYNAFVESDGKVWLATNEGLIRYYPELDTGILQDFNTLIREVSTEHDSILFHGTYYKEVPGIDGVAKIKVASLEQPEFMKPVLTYRFNSVKFSFSAVSFIREDQNSYQYKLDGFDRDWSSWTSENSKEYTNLREGKYVFHVKGKNVFGSESDEALYAFTILPPWYRTLWSYAGFALMAILLVYLIVKLTVRRLKASNVLLENNVKERTREITQKNSQLEQQKEELLSTLENLQKTRDQLIESEKMAALGGLVAGVAHEINTPVGVGITAVSTLQEKLQKMAVQYKNDEISRKDFKEFFESVDCAALLIQKNLERTASLIQSFKQVSVDQVTEQQRVFALKEYLDDILISLKPKFIDKKIAFKIECDEELQLKSYPGIYAQIFTNMLLNSLQHGFPEKNSGIVQIKASLDKNILKIIYRDDGAGVSPKDLPHIFEPFYTSDQHRGTGLGLNIVYNLIKQKLHGTISCISEPGQGALFTIEVPA